jgi:hypothetical protein
MQNHKQRNSEGRDEAQRQLTHHDHQFAVRRPTDEMRKRARRRTSADSDDQVENAEGLPNNE